MAHIHFHTDARGISFDFASLLTHTSHLHYSSLSLSLSFFFSFTLHALSTSLFLNLPIRSLPTCVRSLFLQHLSPPLSLFPSTSLSLSSLPPLLSLSPPTAPPYFLEHPSPSLPVTQPLSIILPRAFLSLSPSLFFLLSPTFSLQFFVSSCCLCQVTLAARESTIWATNGYFLRFVSSLSAFAYSLSYLCPPLHVCSSVVSYCGSVNLWSTFTFTLPFYL